MIHRVHHHRGGEVLRVVIGEDSAFMRRLIVDALEEDPGIEVIGEAADGREALRMVVELRPDCVTLDLEMPRMDGLETLRYIMGEWPTPVVILSAHTESGARTTFDCLEAGAVDFVTKTRRGSVFDGAELRSKVRAAASVDAAKVRFEPPARSMKVARRRAVSTDPCHAVIIGASTGGPQALMEVVPRLPADLEAAVVVVQHMPPNFTRYMAERLDACSMLPVIEAEEGMPVRPGQVIVAPGGMHLFVQERRTCPAFMLLARNRFQRTACPSVDFAMTSFSSIFGERMTAVVLTGMGKDGVSGCRAVRAAGGGVICQNRETSMIFGMPGAVVASGIRCELLPLPEIARAVTRSVNNAAAREACDEGR